MDRNDIWTLTDSDREIQIALLFLRFQEVVKDNLRMLEAGISNSCVSKVAWVARNLLEVNIWVEYCNQSQEHAWAFFCDAIRDLVDVTERISEPDQKLKDFLEKAIGIIGTVPRATKFKQVSQAAKELGKGKFYSDACKGLSKFAHPTALSVVFPVQRQEQMSNEFASHAKEFARDAQRILESSHMAKLYAKYEKAIATTKGSSS